MESSLVPRFGSGTALDARYLKDVFLWNAVRDLPGRQGLVAVSGEVERQESAHQLFIVGNRLGWLVIAPGLVGILS